MKKNKIKRFPFLLVFTVCIVSAFAFLMAITNSNITNLIATDPNTEFNITYDLKDGKFEENTTAPTKYKYIEETSIPNPVKDGSEFLGWTINDKESEPVKDYKIPKGTTGDIKLTANWKVKGSMLYDGITFNETIYSLLMNIDGYSPSNDLSIKFIKGIPLDVNSYPNTSVGDGVTAYFKNGVLYVASDNIIYANRDCSSMFDLIYYRTGGSNRTPKTLIDHTIDHTSGFIGHLTIKSIEFNNFNTVNVTNMEGMFRHCSSLVKLDLTGFNLDNVSNYNYMFENCSNLSSKITITNNLDMSFSDYINMFKGCSTDPNSKFYVDYSKDKVLLYDVVRSMIKTKSENSNVFLYETSMLVDSDKFSAAFSKAAIGLDSWTDYTIKFSKGNPVISEYQPDISEAQDGSISISADQSSGHRCDMIHVTSNKIIKFNKDSSSMFYNTPTGVFKFENIDTSEVENMDYMFSEIGNYDSFDLDISKFDTQNVKTANKMFCNSSLITNIKGLADFNFGNLISANDMFAGCNKLSGSITISNPNITSYTNMFRDCSTDPNAKFIVKYVDEATKKVATEMVATKSENSNVYLDGTQPATLMAGEQFRTTLEGMSGFSNVEEIRFIKGTPNPNGTNVAVEGEAKAHIEGNVLTVASEGEIFANKDCYQMFYRFGNLEPMSETCDLIKISFDNFNTSNVTDMSSMFQECGRLTNIDVSVFDTSQVTDMNNMFYMCESLETLDLNNFKNDKVTNTSYMFKNCFALTNLNLGNFNIGKIDDIKFMFDECYNLMNIKGLESFYINNVTDMTGIFYDCSKLSGEITISNPNITTYSNMFYNCSTNPNSKFIVKYTNDATKALAKNMVATKTENSNVYLDGTQPATLMDGNTFNSTIRGMSGFENVTEIRFVKGTPNTNGTNVAIDGIAKAYISGNMLTVASEGEIFANSNCKKMFLHFSSLTSLDLSNFDTSKVTDMNSMFYYCTSLTSIRGIENFDTSKVADIGFMFFFCKNLSGEITIASTNADLYYDRIFYGCSRNLSTKFILNYTSGCRDIAQKIVNGKDNESNIVLGTQKSLLSEDIPNKEESSVPDTVILTIKDGSTTTTKEILAGEIGNLNTPSKEGMIFSGYFYDIEFTKPVSEKDVISEDITIYIKWEEVPQVEEIPQEETKEESLEVA